MLAPTSRRKRVELAERPLGTLGDLARASTRLAGATIASSPGLGKRHVVRTIKGLSPRPDRQFGRILGQRLWIEDRPNRQVERDRDLVEEFVVVRNHSRPTALPSLRI